MQKLHAHSEHPKKKSKKHPFTREEKQANKALSSQQMTIEQVIGAFKRFKIISERSRNRRKRFGLRFNLSAGIYNLQVG
jgi:hypothetical protein